MSRSRCWGGCGRSLTRPGLCPTCEREQVGQWESDSPWPEVVDPFEAAKRLAGEAAGTEERTPVTRLGSRTTGPLPGPHSDEPDGAA